MAFLLGLARGIDALNARVARVTMWLVLGVTLIAAGNALVRKVFDVSSNAFLEIQWYLFSAIFLLCAADALRRNAHVRIDVIAGRFSRRTQAWIDVFGTLCFLFPMAFIVLILSGEVFLEAWRSGETSPSAGGLMLWPARLLVPVGFALLILQGASELIKRIAFLAGRGADPLGAADAPSAEQALAADIVRSQQEKEGRA
ncbi:MAG: TRAP transporter small permease subunit [Candidatus Dactylopiibacterium sp.]|nr:TRAP transporter small permease subunit [Candidatus Dactylopiibacterium sp.]